MEIITVTERSPLILPFLMEIIIYMFLSELVGKLTVVMMTKSFRENIKYGWNKI